MSDGPKVTVLTPVYNGEPYIAKCIESVLQQSYTNWEYVIVNNCNEIRTQRLRTDRRADHLRRCRTLRLRPSPH